MAERAGSEWGGGLGPGDTCDVAVSIPSQARTEPPDKQSSPLREEGTVRDNHVYGSSNHISGVGGGGSALPALPRPTSYPGRSTHVPPAAGAFQQTPTKDFHYQKNRKTQHPRRGTPDGSLRQVWIPQRASPQHSDHQGGVSVCVHQTSSVSERDAGKPGEVKNAEKDYTPPSPLCADSRSPQEAGEVETPGVFSTNEVSQVGSQSNLAQVNFTSSISPRFSRCRRQHRVSSFDEPPNDVTKVDTPIKETPRRVDHEVKDYQTFVNGSTSQTSAVFSSPHLPNNGNVVTPPSQQTLSDQTEAPAKISHVVIDSYRRLSLEKCTILNQTSCDVTPSENSSSTSRRRQKEKKAALDDNTISDVPSNQPLISRGKDKPPIQPSSTPQDDSGSVPPSSTVSSKSSRRLGRRGMFPSSNWRRLRNTLKAANEMQSSRKSRHGLNREDSFLRKFSTRHHMNIQNASCSVDEDARRSYYAKKLEGRFVIQHDGNFMFYWLAVVTVSVLYNLWTCIARQAFREIQQGCPACWFSFDALFDLIYVCDIIVQFRTGYLDQGLMVYDSKKLRQKYFRSRVIYIDFLCLLPLDLLQILTGVYPMIRFPRFLKIYRPLRFLHMLESRTAYPNLIRVANLTHILFLGAHWFAAFYYMISEAEGFKGDWSYPKPVGEFADVKRKYLRSLFWSTLTLTTIGDLPPPCSSNDVDLHLGTSSRSNETVSTDNLKILRMSNAAYVFVIVSYLIGVFVFATIVGQVGNVINNRNASRQEFERLLDGAKIYMQTHNVPHNLQKRVQRWYDYVWSRGRLNGCDINSLGLLPDKLKTELAIHVNLETLKKVTIFQECQPEFLHDLVLKMKAFIFTPGDLICRRGEVAREMFIIADGVVEIISETGVILKRMGAGDFFGEIGILNLDGGINRRTADVRSVGYLELFVLSREDVLAALKDHPEAECIIRDYGQRRLREVEAHRQKVKPLKCKGSTEQPGNATGTPQTVQNRLLQTLRSLNPVVRRQSAQVNHVGSPSPLSQTGSPTDAMQRLPSGQLPDHFLFDETKSSATVTKVKPDESSSPKVKLPAGGGRSLAMSIIQQPTADFSYQQLAVQINVLQGMIEKRLCLLEEAYGTATAKLEYLATTQDMLVSLLKQQLLSNQKTECLQLEPTEVEDTPLTSLI